MRGKDPVSQVHVPGRKFAMYPKPGKSARHATSALLQMVTMLNNAGWSLGGKFSVSDFLVSPLGLLKFEADLLCNLEKITPQCRKKDMKAAGDVACIGIFQGATNMPADMKNLLKLLRNFKVTNLIVILNHPALLNEAEKLSLFGCMYMRWLQLQKLDKVKYNAIIAKMPYCKGEQKSQWKARVSKSKYLQRVLNFNSSVTSPPASCPTCGATRIRQRKTKFYTRRGVGLLRLVRNSFQHLVDQSVKNLLQLFKFLQMEHVVGHPLPRIICMFMMAMHHEGEFECQKWHEPALCMVLLQR
ncbi:hypothetical protein QOZ80_3AG0215750 [Eleusine coracana subsp. coracana]|nr:hypothetical protein QOZ80_3AG0215750 [Eleusine coracana subsp. coracana]